MTKVLKAISLLFISIIFNGCFGLFSSSCDDTLEGSYYTPYYDKMEQKDYEFFEYIALRDFYKSNFYNSLKTVNIIAVSDSLITPHTLKVDLAQIDNKIFASLRKTGKFRYSRSLNGGISKAETLLKEARKARENEEFKQDGAIEKDNLLVPKYAYASNLTSKCYGWGYGTNKRCLFLYVAEIVDLTTGEVVWNFSGELTKGHRDY